MSNTFNFLTGLQRDIAEMLAAAEPMQNVQVIVEAERKHNSGGVTFEKALSDALQGKVPVNGKVGLAVVVFCPEGKPMTRANSGLVVDFQITVRVIENGTLNASPTNGTGMSCEELVVEAMLLVQNWTPLRGHTLTIESFGRVEMENNLLWAWEFVVKAHDAQDALEKCGLPKIQVGGDNFALITTTTEGASLYYTLDGTLPTPRNGILYQDAVKLTDGDELRAMAWAPGKMPSDCATPKNS